MSIHRCYKRYRDGAMQGAWSGCFQGYRGEAIHYLGYGLPRIPILSTSVNKDEITLSALTIHREFIATDYSARSGL
jgi:hypothetical protein